MNKCIQDLDDFQQYDALVLEWNSRWKDIVARAGETFDWETPWFDPQLGDGSLKRDANPIFSAVCPSRQLGVRIIQHDYSSPDLNWWTDLFAEGDPDEEIRELVIVCPLYEIAMDEACALIDQWIASSSISSSVPEFTLLAA